MLATLLAACGSDVVYEEPEAASGAGSGTTSSAATGATSSASSGAGGGTSSATTTGVGGATPCDAAQCVGQGHGCGVCLENQLACGSEASPWPGWNTPVQAGDLDSFSTLAPEPELTGHGSDNGGADTDFAYLNVGQGPPPTGVHTRVGLTFDLGGLPAGATIVAAHLHVHQYSSVNLAFSSPLTEVVVEPIRFTSVWGIYDAPSVDGAMGAVAISTTPGEGWRVADVTAAVRHELATCRATTQLRLRFSPGEGVSQSDTINVASFNSELHDNEAHHPRLELRWR